MKTRRRTADPYLLAVALTCGAILIRVPLWSWLGIDYPYLTFYPAVMIAALQGGIGPGALTLLLSVLSIVYFLLPPLFSFQIAGTPQIIALAYFNLLCGALVWLGNQVRVARYGAETQRQRTWQTVSSVTDGLISTDQYGKVQFLNPAAERLTGWTLSEAAGRAVAEVFVVRDEQTGGEVEDPVRRVLAGGESVAPTQFMLLVAKNGDRTPIDHTGSPILDDRGGLIGAVIVFRSVAERRVLEAQLRDREQRLSRLAESNVIGILFGDIFGNIRDANDELLRMIGRTREELRRGEIRWIDITPPEHLPADERALAEARERGACTTYEKEYLRSDGTRVPILVGYVLLGEERVESVAFIADLTARKEAERASREAAEELQHFTFGASHDLKEPLRMVSMYSQMLERRYAGTLEGDGLDYLRFIRQGTERMHALVSSILDYARAGEVRLGGPGRVDTRQALDESLSALRGAIEETGATIHCGPMPDVHADALHVAQLFQNLVGNAIRYRSEAPPIVQVGGTREDGVCTFFVQDNGAGIPPEFHDKVFGLFQRLHGRDRDGTGLGLPTCKRIVERYGGRIWVESEGEGRGSTFRFTLPAAEGD